MSEFSNLQFWERLLEKKQRILLICTHVKPLRHGCMKALAHTTQILACRHPKTAPDL